MKNISFFFAAAFTAVMAACVSACSAVYVEWVATTPDTVWAVQDARGLLITGADSADAEIDPAAPQQTIDGFGACFNELGWTALAHLSDADREAIMRELFAPGAGANLSVCRMPVAANDFSRQWYSYNETDGDFTMQNFSIENDRETLVPFIHNALQYNPDLRLWASPWSPPVWMKTNRHYACAVSSDFFDKRYHNDITPQQVRKEGENMFIQDDRYFAAYALYFKRFIEEYRKEGINVSMVMPQNEFNSCQPFPSCTWTAAGLNRFVGGHLGPAMEALGVDVFFGTMERPNAALADTLLQDPQSSRYIKGLGFQWAGKRALSALREKYPHLKIYQTEQECGNGENDWNYCRYAWSLMKHYFRHGASVYSYWNIALEDSGMSRWGWQQNSFVTVAPQTKTYRYTYEYYLFKHASHYVQSGAKLLPSKGRFADLLAFANPDGKYVVVLCNHQDSAAVRTIKIGNLWLRLTLPPNSINTVRL